MTYKELREANARQLAIAKLMLERAEGEIERQNSWKEVLSRDEKGNSAGVGACQPATVSPD